MCVLGSDWGPFLRKLDAMTSRDRQAAAIEQAKARERRKLMSDAANLLRPYVARNKALGVMSQNARDWLDRLVDDLEAGAV